MRERWRETEIEIERESMQVRLTPMQLRLEKVLTGDSEKYERERVCVCV